MKRMLSFMALMLLCLVLFSGCQCSHEWVDADCITPVTCANCGKTEGEPLGHTWVDATCTAPRSCSLCGLTERDILEHSWKEATCAAPKTCDGCGLTEGDALEHTWQDANYQVPKTCSVCAGTEGDPIPSDFESLGLRFNVEEVGVSYPLTLGGKDFTYTIDHYAVFASDDSHAALEGYEWRTVSHRAECLQGSIPRTLNTYGDYNDYYSMDGFNDSVVPMDTNHLFAATFTVNYYGVDYTDCCFQIEKSNLDNTASGWKLEETMSFRVPVGYDGIFVCMGDARFITNDYFTQYKDLYADENTRFFRLN